MSCVCVSARNKCFIIYPIKIKIVSIIHESWIEMNEIFGKNKQQQQHQCCQQIGMYVIIVSIYNRAKQKSKQKD